MFSIFSGNSRKVIVSREGVAAFNRQWPCSKLDSSRHYWFEFDDSGELVDCDVPEHSDGIEANVLAGDAMQFFLEGDLPDYAN